MLEHQKRMHETHKTRMKERAYISDYLTAKDCKHHIF